MVKLFFPTLCLYLESSKNDTALSSFSNCSKILFLSLRSLHQAVIFSTNLYNLMVIISSLASPLLIAIAINFPSISINFICGFARIHFSRWKSAVTVPANYHNVDLQLQAFGIFMLFEDVALIVCSYAS